MATDWSHIKPWVRRHPTLAVLALYAMWPVVVLMGACQGMLEAAYDWSIESSNLRAYRREKQGGPR